MVRRVRRVRVSPIFAPAPAMTRASRCRGPSPCPCRFCARGPCREISSSWRIFRVWLAIGRWLARVVRVARGPSTSRAAGLSCRGPCRIVARPPADTRVARYRAMPQFRAPTVDATGRDGILWCDPVMGLRHVTLSRVSNACSDVIWITERLFDSNVCSIEHQFEPGVPQNRRYPLLATC